MLVRTLVIEEWESQNQGRNDLFEVRHEGSQDTDADPDPCPYETKKNGVTASPLVLNKPIEKRCAVSKSMVVFLGRSFGKVARPTDGQGY